VEFHLEFSCKTYYWCKSQSRISHLDYTLNCQYYCNCSLIRSRVLSVLGNQAHRIFNQSRSITINCNQSQSIAINHDQSGSLAINRDLSWSTVISHHQELESIGIKWDNLWSIQFHAVQSCVQKRSAIWSIFDIVLSAMWPAKIGTVLHTMPPTITCKNYNPIP
jgi:hypothetical protein